MVNAKAMHMAKYFESEMCEILNAALINHDVEMLQLMLTTRWNTAWAVKTLAAENWLGVMRSNAVRRAQAMRLLVRCGYVVTGKVCADFAKKITPLS